MFERSSTIRLLRYGIISLAALAIVSYAAWRSLNYARGPEIIVTTPADGSAVSVAESSSIYVKGQAYRIKDIALNGREITIDEQGNFNEPLVIFQGLNFISLTARDQFGRSIKKEVRVVGE